MSAVAIRLYIRHPLGVSLCLTSSSQFALAQGRQGCGNSHCFWVVRVLALCFAIVSFLSVLASDRDAAPTLPTATTFDVSLASVVCSLRPHRCPLSSHGTNAATWRTVAWRTFSMRPAQPALSCILPTDTIFWPAVSKQG